MTRPTPFPEPTPVTGPAGRPDPMPTREVEFPQMFRNGRAPWWKGALAIVVFCIAYFIISNALALIAVAIDAATGRLALADLQVGRIQLTPALLLATNLANALAIPLSLLLQLAFYGQPVRWAHSVVGYVRWRLMARAAVVVVPVWLALVVLPTLLTAEDGGRLGAESIGLLVIVLLTTPLQAAGEEYGARGLITRAAGTWAADPRVSLLIGTGLSASLFAVAHAAADPWLILYYFSFGVAMSIIVWRTGGLEVCVLVHAVNNMAAFLALILAGQSLTIDRSAGSGGPGVLFLVAVLAGLAALVWWRARAEGVTRSYRPVGSLADQSSSEPAQLPGEPPR